MNEELRRRPYGGSVLNLIFGIWLIISPFVLGFSANNVAEWNNIASGIAIGLLALSGASWLNVLLGLWVIASPFALGFAGAPTLLWNNVILGAVVALVAALSISSRPADIRNAPPA